MLARPAFAAVALAALLVLSACTNGGGGSGDGRLRVITTVSPITSLAENIGGTRIKLQGLIPEGVNSHTYEPPVSDVRVLADADLIIMNGLKLEEPTRELAEANKQADAVILLVGEETLTPAEYKYDFSFPESEGKPNPHLWPNPALSLEYATLIHDKLVLLDPDNANYYDANFQELKRRLEALDAAMHGRCHRPRGEPQASHLPRLLGLLGGPVRLPGHRRYSALGLR